MTTVTDPTTDLFATPSPDAPAERIADRVMACLLGANELLAMYLGDRLGWYRALRDHGPSTSAELARLTGTVERYAREWLEHQAVSGYLAVTGRDGSAATDPGARRYALLPGAAEVLTDEDSPLYLAPQARFVAASGRSLDALVNAYHHGGGVSWAELGVDAREAQAHTNRPLFLHHLAQDLIPAVPDLDARLRAGARVADVGCGEGWSGIGLAIAHDGVTVDGYDIDQPSIEAARRHAAEAGVGDRVRFRVADATGDLAGAGTYDVVAAFECIHDLPDPVAVLASMRRLAGEDGYVLVMDEHAGETFRAPAGPVERALYGYSLLVCLPDGMSHEPSAATGTVMRPAVLERYARDAGFSRLEVLPVEHEMFRFYRLHL